MRDYELFVSFVDCLGIPRLFVRQGTTVAQKLWNCPKAYGFVLRRAMVAHPPVTASFGSP